MKNLNVNLKILQRDSKSEFEKDIFGDIVTLPVNTIENLKKNYNIDLSEEDFNNMINYYMTLKKFKYVYCYNDSLENIAGLIISFNVKQIVIKYFDTPKGLLCKKLKNNLHIGVIFSGIVKPFTNNIIDHIVLNFKE